MLTAGKDYDKNIRYTYACDTLVGRRKNGNKGDTDLIGVTNGTEVSKEDIILSGTRIKATITGIW